MGKLKFYSELRDGPWLLRAYFPSNTKQRQEWTVYVHHGDDLVRQVKLPMERSAKFGPDGADVAELNVAVASLMKDLIAGASSGDDAGGRRTTGR
jgi:hypothetical protein